MQVRLGAKMKDTITDLEGIVVCRSEWLHGDVRVGIQPQALKDGAIVDVQWIDEPRLVVRQPEQ
jgi:hypothetical protein